MYIVSHNTLGNPPPPPQTNNIKKCKSSTPNDHKSLCLTSRHVFDSEQLQKPNVTIKCGEDFISLCLIHFDNLMTMAS